MGFPLEVCDQSIFRSYETERRGVPMPIASAPAILTGESPRFFRDLNYKAGWIENQTPNNLKQLDKSHFRNIKKQAELAQIRKSPL
jgi:hypothetical protein